MCGNRLKYFWSACVSQCGKGKRVVTYEDSGLSQPILRKWDIHGVPNKRIWRLISVPDK